MADAKLSPRELAALLDKLDDAQRQVEAVRAQLIRAMAARRRTPAQAARSRARVRVARR